MTNSSWRRLRSQACFASTVLLVLFVFDPGFNLGRSQPAQQAGTVSAEKPPGQEFGLRGQRAARDLRRVDTRRPCRPHERRSR